MKPVIWIACLLKCEIRICIRESWWLSTGKLAAKSLGFWWLQKWVFAGWAEALALQLGLSDPKQLPLNGCLKCVSLSTHPAHGPPWERFPSPCEGTERKKAMQAQLKLFLYQLIELYSSAAAWQEILLFHAQHLWLLLLPREVSAMLQQRTSSEKSFPRHPNKGDTRCFRVLGLPHYFTSPLHWVSQLLGVVVHGAVGLPVLSCFLCSGDFFLFLCMNM